MFIIGRTLIFLLFVSLIFVEMVFSETSSSREVNIYSHRHYDVDLELFRDFENETKIKVNLIEGSSDELIQRLVREGKESPADILITVDAGRLYRAKTAGLLQSVSSETLRARVPSQLRDPEGYWYGLTQRARIIAYHPGRVNRRDLDSYESLTDPIWRGRILIRSSANIYNQSLLASIIAHHGEKHALEWASGMVSNMARKPKGNDRGQIIAIAAGHGDIAIVNSYYIGKMLNSSNPEERLAAEQVKIFYPNQDDRGTHMNITGAGITANAKNLREAIELLEFLTGEKAQQKWAQANHEYPIRSDILASDLLRSWGPYKADALGLHNLGALNNIAVRTFDQAGWR